MSQHDFQPRQPSLDAYLCELRDGLRDPFTVQADVIYTVSAYVDVAKRILLEHRVRDFQASDVVALAAMMEARDRSTRIAKPKE